MNNRIFPLLGWARGHSLKLFGVLALLAGLTLVPFVVPSLYYIKLINQMLIFGLLAMSLDVLLGYTGLLSFMHNAYLGIGAYITGIFLIYFSSSLWLALLAGIAGTSLIAFVVGIIQVRTGGLAFALLTIAFGMMFYTLAWKLEITGGSDGLIGVPFPDISLGGLVLGNTGDPGSMYLFTLAVVVVCYLLTKRILDSPFGGVLEAIRENEERVSFTGYNVQKYKLLGWMLACVLASISGGLFILYKGYIGPPTMDVFSGAAVLIMLLLGGMGSLWGPMIGAGIFIYLEDYFGTLAGEQWQFFVGLIVVLLVLFLPRGAATISDRIRLIRGK